MFGTQLSPHSPEFGSKAVLLEHENQNQTSLAQQTSLMYALASANSKQSPIEDESKARVCSATAKTPLLSEANVGFAPGSSVAADVGTSAKGVSETEPVPFT